MINTLIFDLDGTLLTSRNRLSDKTAAALFACADQNIRILFATARPPLLHMLSVDAHHASLFDNPDGIFYNGGCYILDGVKRYRTIDSDLLKNVLQRVTDQWGQRLNIALLLEHEEHSFLHPLTEQESRLWGIDPHHLVSFDEALERRVVKVLIFSTSGLDKHLLQNLLKPDDLALLMANIEELYGELQREHSGLLTLFMTDQKKVIQIMAGGVDKVRAIHDYLAESGISHDQVAVFGDDFPDIKMLQAFTHSFAMGNAPDEVKRAATHVTKSNDDEGIHYALSEILGIVCVTARRSCC
jgi:Cof subfamily protein (haloacid dehalogenase superfamily)